MSLQSQNSRGSLRLNSGKEEFVVIVLKPRFYCSTESSVCFGREYPLKVNSDLFTEPLLGVHVLSHEKIWCLNKL